MPIVHYIGISRMPIIGRVLQAKNAVKSDTNSLSPSEFAHIEALVEYSLVFGAPPILYWCMRCLRFGKTSTDRCSALWSLNEISYKI